MNLALAVANNEVGKTDAAGQPLENATPLIQLERIHKIYSSGDVEMHALRGISLNIYPGEFVAIMGTSGSGKSTMMNILGCLDRPTRGSYLLDGEDISQLEKDERADIRNRKIGFVFQGFNLLSRTSALENIELPLLYANVATEERRQRAIKALQAVGLAGREESRPNQLSGGQQQRVAIARALVNQPALILADEPTGNLDSRTSVEVMALFQKLNDDHGITVVLVTHEPDIAEYTDRVVVFKDGKIRRDYEVIHPRNAAAELMHMPESTDEDDD
jgi:putative ABC transport system ATP-binding protein